MSEPILYSAPSYEQFVVGLRAVENDIHDDHRKLVTVHCQMPNSTATATDLAERCGWTDWRIVNRQYGFFSERICRAIDFVPSTKKDGKPRWWGIHSAGRDIGNGRFEWIMHPQLVAALEEVGWVQVLAENDVALSAPRDSDGYAEGSRSTGEVTRYERSKRAREACIAIHGCVCQICGFDFEVTYGEFGHGYIQVHHTASLASQGRRQTNPEVDLIPVCPNCHAMLHRRTPALLPDELRQILRHAS